MEIQTIAFIDLDPNGSYTYSDYLSWTFEERLELFRGRISLQPRSYTPLHQTVMGNLVCLLYPIARISGLSLFHGPLDVRLFAEGLENDLVNTVVQPDILLVEKEKLDEDGCVGTPLFVVEIISAATAEKDLITKFALYQEAGVKEYWIVHTGDKYNQCYVLEGVPQFS